MSKQLGDHQASLAYVRYLNLVDAVLGQPDTPNLNQSERALLDFLARRWAVQQPITVLETMACGVDGMSKSTVHRRLKSLCRSGMIELQADAQDNRIKLVTPTALALSYLDQLGHCLLSSKAMSVARPA